MRTLRRWWNGSAVGFGLGEWVPATWCGRIGGVVLAAGLIGICLSFAIKPDLYRSAATTSGSAGFGQDWECSDAPYAQICFRKTPRAPRAPKE